MDLNEVLAAFNALPEAEQKEALAMADGVLGERKFVPNPGPQTDAYFSEADELFYGGAAGGGKDLELSTKIKTLGRGWQTMGSLQVGDYVFGSDGAPTKVVAKSDVLNPSVVYKVTLNTGEEFKCSATHMWLTRTDSERQKCLTLTPEWRGKRRKSRPSRAKQNPSKGARQSDAAKKSNSERVHSYLSPPEPVARSTQELLQTLRVRNGKRANHSIDVVRPLHGKPSQLPMDPYLLGLWLGDGFSASGRIGMLSCDLDEVLPRISAIPHSRVVDTCKSRKQSFEMVSFPGMWKSLCRLLQKSKVLKSPRALQKAIPQSYQDASVDQRMELLRGIMDTDGTVAKGSGACEIALSDKVLIDSVRELLSGLGIKTTLQVKRLSLKNPNHRDSYRIKFYCSEPCFYLSRKRALQNLTPKPEYTQRRYIASIEQCERVETQCIQVDNEDHSYCIGETFVITHNSALLCGLAVDDYKPALILRREATQIKSLESELERLLGSRTGYNSQSHVWKMAGGDTIELGGVPHDKDKEKYQGRPHRLKGFDEITQFTEAQYRYIIGWLRDAQGRRCRVVCTGNPPTSAEGMWVVSYWGPWLDKSHPNPAEPGELRWFTTIDGEDTEVDGKGPHLINGEYVEARSRTFIPSKLEDNPDLMASGYAATLEAMPKELRDRLRHGAFDVETEDDEWQAIPSAWVKAAQTRWTERPPEGMKMTAVASDVAQGGDDQTVIQARHDWWYGRFLVKKGKETPDGPSVAAEIVKVMRDRARVVVDAGGGYGGDALTQLAQSDITCFGFKGSQGATGASRDNMFGFKNLRAQAVWQFREALDPAYGSMIALPPDPELLADLCAYRYEVKPGGSSSQGQVIQIRPKEEMREQLGRSPDKGDTSIMLHASHYSGLKKPKISEDRQRDQKRQMHAVTSNARTRLNKRRGIARR